MRFLSVALLALLVVLPAPAGAYSGPGQSALIVISRSVNFNSAADTQLAIPAQYRVFRLLALTVGNCSANMTTAQGGFYSAASQGGTNLVAVTGFTGNTSGAVITPMVLTSAAVTTRWSANSSSPPINSTSLPIIYFHVSTIQGAAATCDIGAEIIDYTKPS